MVHMLSPGKDRHSQHHDDIGNLIASSSTTLYTNVLAKHFGYFELVSKAAKMGQTSVGSEFFFIKLNMKSTHHIEAS